jgi:hypothetical protein
MKGRPQGRRRGVAPAAERLDVPASMKGRPLRDATPGPRCPAAPPHVCDLMKSRPLRAATRAPMPFQLALIRPR